MGIFDEFCRAFSDVIEDYKKEKQSYGKLIAPHRLADLAALTELLADNNQNASLLRKKVVFFIEHMKTHPFANIFSVFDSELRKKLRLVLENPEFDEISLATKEFMEAQAAMREAKLRDEAIEQQNKLIIEQNTIIIQHLNGEKVIELVNQVNTLTQLINTQTSYITKLENMLKENEEVCNSLESRCGDLQKENRKLKEEIAALKQASQNNDPANSNTENFPRNFTISGLQ